MMGFISDLFRGKNWIEKLPKGKHKLTRYHWYNMVSPSPWPFLISMSTLPIIIGGVGCMQGINDSLEALISGFLAFLFFFILWNRDIIRESTYMGVHTKQVDANTILGFKLFLFTETMLFVSFFWAHLYSALYPSVFIGLSWPPVGLADLLLDPFDIPLTNTVILVYSGFTVTLSHLYLRRGSIFLSAITMAITILFGLAFLYIQYSEYNNAEFDISDGIYGSTFYMLTGFHGGHVIIGVTALIVTLIRLIELHFSSYSHTGFKLALIYWHFVDVVWIFVFLIVYVLGSDLTYPNIAYYPDSNMLGCVINVDQALFGKPWRGADFFQSDSTWFLGDSPFDRVSWFQLTYYGHVSEISGLEMFTMWDENSMYNKWFSHLKIPKFTNSENIKLLHSYVVNDQNFLSKYKTHDLEARFFKLYKKYVSAFQYYDSNHRYDDYEIQWLYAEEDYQREEVHAALDLFYTLKILPSILRDAECADSDEGFDNFYGKLVVYTEGHKRIDSLDIRDYYSPEEFTLVTKSWEIFWPNCTHQGFIPKYLRVMFHNLNGLPGKYPCSLTREFS